MSCDKVQDCYSDDEFEEILSEAEGNASNDFEIGFVTDMRDKFEEYGKRMFISERQREILESIANDE